MELWGWRAGALTDRLESKKLAVGEKTTLLGLKVPWGGEGKVIRSHPEEEKKK